MIKHHISSQDYGSLVVLPFKEKLPKVIRLLIRGKLPTEGWTPENVKKNFRAEIETRERCGPLANPESKKPVH